MSGLVLKRPFRDQPQTAWQPSPEYADAVILSPFRTDGLNIANENHTQQITAGSTPVFRDHGRAINFPGTGNGFYRSDKQIVHTGKKFTVFAWVRPLWVHNSYYRFLATDYSTGFYLGSDSAGKYTFTIAGSALEGNAGGQQVIGKRDFICGVYDGASAINYVNGIEVSRIAASSPTSFQYVAVGASPTGTSPWTGDVDTVGVFYRPFSSGEVQEIYKNPGRLFKAPGRRVWFIPGEPGPVTGTVAYTNADDISFASATPTVTASSATTNADDVSVANAAPVIVGESATTNADDVSNATAAAGSAAEGSVAYTNIDDASNAVAVPTVTGSVAATNAEDISAANATVTVTATVAVTNSNDISVASTENLVTASVAVTNADDISAAAASPIVDAVSATTNADDVSVAEAVAEVGEVIATVEATNADDVSVAVAAPVIVGSVSYSNLHDFSAAIAVINFGTIVEAALTSGIIDETRIKKPGIPSDAPDWLRNMFEILTGRRGNKVDVAPHQDLTFSATPTKEECEALYSYISDVRKSIDQLTKRFDS